MPSNKGDFCARCATRTESARVTEDEGDFIIYSCPKGHGEQYREKAPEPAAE